MLKKMFCFLIFFCLSTKLVFAGGFNLKSIGSVSTGGQQISHWWCSGLSPVFVGEAVAGSEVNISIDGTSANTTADGSGSWMYSTEALTSGDHKIVLISGGSTISFTLTLGTENVDYEAVNKGNVETLPTAGIYFPTLILLGVGGFLFLTAKKLAK